MRISPHTLRHTFDTDNIDRLKIQLQLKMLWHSNITTTMIYIHMVDADVEKALSGGVNEKGIQKNLTK